MPKEGTNCHMYGSWIGEQCLDAADHSSMALRFGKIRELYNLDSQPRWLFFSSHNRKQGAKSLESFRIWGSHQALYSTEDIAAFLKGMRNI